MTEQAKTFQRATLIGDEPSKQDAFSGQGHKRSAKALAVALEDLSNTNSLIGLEGEWGSGKSTVIELVKGEINKNERLHFFCFDLWSHQPDVFKLAFLEEFIAWAALPEQNLLTKEEAQKFQNRISDKIVTTRVENKREYKLSAVLFILLFPLLPIAYTWLSPLTFSNNVDAQVTSSARDLALIYMALLYALFFSAFIFGLKNYSRSAAKFAFSSAAKVFTKESDHDELVQHVKENNPTSEKFQSFFREVLLSAQKKGDRIVLILDNIDRLPKDILMQFWAEARSIVANVSHQKDLQSTRVTGIIPFDTKCIVEAYKEGSPNRQAEAIQSARSIIEKTFDTTIKVSPPLSTDWRSFLNTRLEEAFHHSISEKEKYRIYRLLDVYFKEKGLFPTPRAIISYINQIVVLWNQWGEEEIPMDHMALYCLLKQNIENNPESLKSIALASQDQRLVMGDSDWLKDVIALFYNVHPDDAYEIVLGQDIEKEIKKGSVSAFLELSDKPGFAEVLPEIVKKYSQQWARSKAYELSAASENLSALNDAEDYVRESWAAMREAAYYHLDGCEVEDAEAYFGLGKIIENTPRSEANKIADRLVGWFSTFFPAEQLNDPGYESYLWSQFYNCICCALSTFDSDLLKDFQRQTKLPAGAKFAVCVCAYSNTQEGFEYKYIQVSHSQNELKEAAIELAQENPELITEIVQVKPRFLDADITQKAVQFIAGRLNSESLSLKVLSELIQTLTELLCLSQNSKELKASLVDYLNSGTFVYHFKGAVEKGDHEIIARIIWLTCEILDGNYILEQPRLKSHPHFGNILEHNQIFLNYLTGLNSDSEEIEIISGLISKSAGFSKWWRFAESESQTKFMRASFCRFVDAFSLGALPVYDVVCKYDSLKAILGEALSFKFIEKFAGWNVYFEKNFKGESCLEISPEFLKDVAKTKNKKLKEIEAIVDSYFNSFEVDEWKSLLLEGNDKQISLLITRVSEGRYKPLLAKFKPAIFEHIKLVLSGKHTLNNVTDNWETLLDALAKKTKANLAKNVFIDLKDISTSTSSVQHFVSVYPNFASLLPLDQNPDLAIEQIITPLISADQKVAKVFMTDNKATIIKCFKKASNDALELVSEAIENQLGHSAEDEEKAWLKSFAFEAGLDLSNDNEDVSITAGEAAE